MNFAAELICCAVNAIWLAVLAGALLFYRRGRDVSGVARWSMYLVALSACVNAVGVLYFGFYADAADAVSFWTAAGLGRPPDMLVFAHYANLVAVGIVLSVFSLNLFSMTDGGREQADVEVLAALHELTQELEEHRHLLDTSIDLIIVTDAERTITRISSSALPILGYAPEEMKGRWGGEFMEPADRDTMRVEFNAALNGSGDIRNFELKLIHKSGHPVLLSWTGVWSDRARKFFLIGRDMTEQRLAAEKLRVLAYFDQLTGLPNRRSLMADVVALQDSDTGAVRSSAIVFFDLDGFKDVNDTLGHAAGDDLLRQVAGRMLNVANEDAQVYRLGSDEFVLLFAACRDPLVIASMTDRILRAVETKFEIDGKDILIGASAGIAISPETGASAEELIANADLALYDAKMDGGRRYYMFQSSMRAAASARREMEFEINRAAADGEFVLFFQPQVRLEDGVIVGAEALLRWNHPERGLLSPGAFIHALERSAESLRIGRWILKTACEAAASWHAKGLPQIRIGVNLFESQLQDKNLSDEVQAALAESRLPARYLEIEITENIALGNDQTTVDSLKALRELGVGIAFDDFGTGYASLKCLTQYPLTRIKIDRSFIQTIGASTFDQEKSVASSLIDMAHNLGLEIIAEGVETASQVAFLQQKNCAEAQGYLFSKPLSAVEFEGFLLGRRSEYHKLTA